MKNRTLLFLLSLFLTAGSFAQSGSRIGQHETLSPWNKVNTSPTASFSSASEGRQIIQDIINVIGLKPNFEIQAANVPNAAAVTYAGKRYVLYNPGFINHLVRTTGNKWAAVSVLAHEVGHHLNGHTITSGGSNPAIELEADEFSGFVLRKMGASLEDAQAAMRILADQRASRTHPAQYDRLTSIAKGWSRADGQGGNPAVAKSTPATRPAARQSQPVASQTGVRTAEPILSERNILGVVRFNADRTSQYYVTRQYNLVQVRNNQLAVIGKLSRLNSHSYPFVIHDHDTRLLVSAQGRILTTSGREVGTLSTYHS